MKLKAKITKFLPVKKNFKHIMPSFEWIKSYSWRFLLGDGVAGFTVAIMLIPQVIAYAILAGMPPEIGLYASLAPILIYALWGGSIYLSVAPVAITSIIVAQSLGPLAQGSLALFIQMASLLAFLEGTIQIIMGLLNLGFIFHFLSLPVINGYISAVALTIIISQLNHIFGITIEKTEKPFLYLYHILKQLQDIHHPTLFISICAILILLYSKIFLRKHLLRFLNKGVLTNLLPRLLPLIVMISAIFYMKFNPLEGIKSIGNLPQGLPSISSPFTTWEMLLTLLPIASYLCLISFMESISVASSLSRKTKKPLDPNREFNALGLANISSSLSGGYSVSGSLSRSAVNFQSGAKSPLSSIFTSVFILFVILFFMPQLGFLPQAILSVVIIVAIYSMIKISYCLSIIKVSKMDTFCFLITFFSVFFFGIKYGLLTGIVTAVFLYMWMTSRPHIAIIGRIIGTEHFRNILRHEVETFPHILIIRIDENLHFANARFFEEKFQQLVMENKETKTLIINACNINFIDTSALDTLSNFLLSLKKEGIQCFLSEIKGPVMDFLKKTNFIQDFGKENIFLSTHLALEKKI